MIFQNRKRLWVKISRQRVDEMMRIRFIIMILLLVLMVSVGCSEKKTEKSSEPDNTTKKMVEDRKKNSVKSKIDLLCLKYDVDSETLKNDLLEYLYTNRSIEQIVSGRVFDTEKLISMSKKHNVPIRKISGIVYDYMIWRELVELNIEMGLLEEKNNE